ncbi:DUF333 domain-containing protein [Parasalinivibrio latis]|uniref:DUF333 domain-containing protein n=1 Tax=Parasalinivibrio latis TaxID=2952610 RepID=UPI0030E21AFB
MSRRHKGKLTGKRKLAGIPGMVKNGFLVTVTLISLAGCSQPRYSNTADQKPETLLVVRDKAVAHCIQTNGEYVRLRDNHGIYALCRLENGIEVDAWWHYQASLPRPSQKTEIIAGF